MCIRDRIKDADYDLLMVATRPLPKTNRIGGMGSTGVTDNGDSITLNITENIPDFIKNKPDNRRSPKIEEVSQKRGRGRPKKTA